MFCNFNILPGLLFLKYLNNPLDSIGVGSLSVNNCNHIFLPTSYFYDILVR